MNEKILSFFCQNFKESCINSWFIRILSCLIYLQKCNYKFEKIQLSICKILTCNFIYALPRGDFSISVFNWTNLLARHSDGDFSFLLTAFNMTYSTDVLSFVLCKNFFIKKFIYLFIIFLKFYCLLPQLS